MDGSPMFRVKVTHLKHMLPKKKTSADSVISTLYEFVFCPHSLKKPNIGSMNSDLTLGFNSYFVGHYTLTYERSTEMWEVFILSVFGYLYAYFLIKVRWFCGKSFSEQNCSPNDSYSCCHLYPWGVRCPHCDTLNTQKYFFLCFTGRSLLWKQRKWITYHILTA